MLIEFSCLCDNEISLNADKDILIHGMAVDLVITSKPNIIMPSKNDVSAILSLQIKDSKINVEISNKQYMDCIETVLILPPYILASFNGSRTYYKIQLASDKYIRLFEGKELIYNSNLVIEEEKCVHSLLHNRQGQ